MVRKSASSSLARFPAWAFAKIAAAGSRLSSSTASLASSRARSIGSRSSMNARTSGRSSYNDGPRRSSVLLEREGEVRTLLELAPEHDERSEDESTKERVELRRTHGHPSRYANSSSSPPLRTQHRPPRAGEKPGLDEELHDVGLRHGDPVEALDRETLRAAGSHMRHERRKCGTKPAPDPDHGAARASARRARRRAQPRRRGGRSTPRPRARRERLSGAATAGQRHRAAQDRPRRARVPPARRGRRRPAAREVAPPLPARQTALHPILRRNSRAGRRRGSRAP